jgi:DNA-directed RNA polymerase subunit L
MAAEPTITVKVKPDMGEVKTLLNALIDVIEKCEQQGNEADKD